MFWKRRDLRLKWSEGDHIYTEEGWKLQHTGFRLQLSFHHYIPHILETLRPPTGQHYTSTAKDLVAYAKSHNQCTGSSQSEHQYSHMPHVPESIVIDRGVQWRCTLEHLSIGSKMIGQGYCQWHNLPTTMPRMPAPVTSYLNSIAATTPKSLSKKMLIPAWDLALLTN